MTEWWRFGRRKVDAIPFILKEQKAEVLELALTTFNRELYEQASADGLITEAEQAGLDALKEDMDELQEYVDAYNEAVEEAESNQEA